jgi:hypothetical protein
MRVEREGLENEKKKRKKRDMIEDIERTKSAQLAKYK